MRNVEGSASALGYSVLIFSFQTLYIFKNSIFEIKLKDGENRVMHACELSIKM